jgi:hypothetical protein
MLECVRVYWEEDAETLERTLDPSGVTPGREETQQRLPEIESGGVPVVPGHEVSLRIGKIVRS